VLEFLVRRNTSDSPKEDETKLERTHPSNSADSLDAREFKSKDGQVIEAELVSVRENANGVLVAEIRRSDRRYFTIPVSSFSPEDQTFLKSKWKKKEVDANLLKPNDRIDINLKLNRKTRNKEVSQSHYSGSVSKDRKLLYEPEVVIKNDELTRSFQGNTIRLVVIAKAMHDDDQYLIACAATLEADFPAKGETAVFGKPYFLMEYEYKSGYSNYDYAYGFENDDYVILVMNKEGEVTHTRASSNRFLENLDNVKSCNTGEVYTEGLKHKLNTSVSSSYYQSTE